MTWIQTTEVRVWNADCMPVLATTIFAVSEDDALLAACDYIRRARKSLGATAVMINDSNVISFDEKSWVVKVDFAGNR